MLGECTVCASYTQRGGGACCSDLGRLLDGSARSVAVRHRIVDLVPEEKDGYRNPDTERESIDN